MTIITALHRNRKSRSVIGAIVLALCLGSWMAPCSEVAAEAPEIQIREHVVFDGDEGWEHGGVTYRLACGAAIKQAPNGDVICWWLSGSGTEPATDNNVLVARSTDQGKTWSEPAILLPAGEMASALTSMHVTSEGKMIAFGAHWPSEARYTVWHYFRMESLDSGMTWTEPSPVSLGSDNIAFGSPIQLANGEFLFGAQFFEKRPKPIVASMADALTAPSEEVAVSLPPGKEPWHDAKFATHRHGSAVLVSPNEHAATFEQFGYIANRPMGLLEPSCIQLKDGRIVMLMRAEMAGFLWRAESTDNGRTWSEAWQTDIPNPTSAIHLLRLSDGRIALLHNACGEVGKMIPRDPLSIWISDDELETWSIKADVLHGGWLAYPCGMNLDGKLVFSYDRNRRQVCFVEVELPAAR